MCGSDGGRGPGDKRHGRPSPRAPGHPPRHDTNADHQVRDAPIGVAEVRRRGEESGPQARGGPERVPEGATHPRGDASDRAGSPGPGPDRPAGRRRPLDAGAESEPREDRTRGAPDRAGPDVERGAPNPHAAGRRGGLRPGVASDVREPRGGARDGRSAGRGGSGGRVGLGGRGAGGGRRCGRGPGDGVVGLGVGGVTGVGGRGSGEACRARMGRDANARHAPASFRRRAALSEPGAPRGARRT